MSRPRHIGDGATADAGFVAALHQVRVRLGARVVLDDVSLGIETREFVGVLGANGAGKTTLMRLILGLVNPARGTVHVFGRPATRGNPSVGYMPQSRVALPPTRLTGRQMVAAAVNGERLGLPWPGRAAWAEVDRVLDLVDAGALARRPMAEMSGGERQRVLLAQALIGQPRLLLLDEPLISLDPHHQHGVVELVRRIQQALGIAVLFSAHDLNPLLGALDRVLYLGGGRAALGTVDEVITGPVLSRLFGTDMDVVRLDGRIFVMAARHESAWGARHAGVGDARI